MDQTNNEEQKMYLMCNLLEDEWIESLDKTNCLHW